MALSSRRELLGSSVFWMSRVRKAGRSGAWHAPSGIGLYPDCSGGSTSPPPNQPAGLMVLNIASGSSTNGTASTSIVAPTGERWDRSSLLIALLADP